MTVGTEHNSKSLATSVWALSGLFPGETTISRTVITHSPCSIGRGSDCDLVLRSKKVSKRHAELIITDSLAIVKDVGSTNGTFVNGSRIHVPTPVGTRDLIQFADVELCVIRDFTQTVDHSRNPVASNRSQSSGSASRTSGTREIDLEFQPLIRAHDQTIFGFDALLRPDPESLASTASLFDTVTGFGREVSVSRHVRDAAVTQMQAARRPEVLFLNADLSELLDQEMLRSLAQLRSVAGQRALVLQIHEQAIPDLLHIRSFSAALRVLNIQLAITEIGFGQSRLQDLTQIRPDFLKFPPELVKGLGTSDEVHFNLVRNLHQIATDFGITTIADGVDSPECISACLDIGFHLLEGPAIGELRSDGPPPAGRQRSNERTRRES